MRKIFLSLFIILFTSMGSNASTIVSYGAGGVPMTALSGTRRVSVVGDHYGFTRNAPFSPEYPGNRYTASYHRCRHCPNNRRLRSGNYNYYPAPMTPSPMVAPQVSRLNKDYTIAPKSSYKRNGITYYN